MAQTTSLVFNGGVIPSPSPAPSGSGKAKLLKIGEITVTEQEVQVTKNVICDPDSVTTVAPFMEVLTSARLAELISANNILVLDDGTMQYLMSDATIAVEDGTSVCTAVNFLGLSKEDRAKVLYPCTRITDELTLQQVLEVGEPVETGFDLVKAYPEDTEAGTLIDKLEIEDTIQEPEDQTLLEVVPTEGKVAINEDRLRETINGIDNTLDSIIETIDELDVDSVPHAYLGSTLFQSAGDSVTTGTPINVFSCTSPLVGDCFEFEQTTTIDDTPFGYVWIEPGTYLINASVTLQWVGDPHGTFIAKVGSVMGENFDFSQEQELKRQSTKVVTIPNRMKLAINITYDAGTPVMGFWIQSLQVVKLAGGMSQTTVAHGLSLEGNGSVAQPLDISEHGLREAFDYAKDKEYFATKQELYPLATKTALQAETARATQRENEIESLFVLPTQEAVDTWLNAHPEATTTVQDGSITESKFTAQLSDLVKQGYYLVTPNTLGEALLTNHKNLLFSEGDYDADSLDIPTDSKWLGVNKNAKLIGNIFLTRNCTIRNLSIDGTLRPTNRQGLSFGNLVDNCKITSGGFYCNDTFFYDNVFTNCEFCDCSSNGFTLVNKGVDGAIYNIRVENSLFHNNGRMNFEAISRTEDPDDNGYERLSIYNCTMTGTYGQINCSLDGLNSHDCSVIGCKFIGENVTYGLEIAGPYNISIVKCFVEGDLSVSQRNEKYLGLLIDDCKLEACNIRGDQLCLRNSEITSVARLRTSHSFVTNNFFNYKPSVTTISSGVINQLILESSSYNKISGNIFKDSLTTAYSSDVNRPLAIYYGSSLYNVIINNQFISDFMVTLCVYGNGNTLSDSSKQLIASNQKNANNVLRDRADSCEKVISSSVTSSLRFDIDVGLNTTNGLKTISFEVFGSGRHNNNTIGFHYFIHFGSYSSPTASPVIFELGSSPALSYSWDSDIAGLCHFTAQNVNISTASIVVKRIC